VRFKDGSSTTVEDIGGRNAEKLIGRRCSFPPPLSGTGTILGDFVEIGPEMFEIGGEKFKNRQKFVHVEKGAFFQMVK